MEYFSLASTIKNVELKVLDPTMVLITKTLMVVITSLVKLVIFILVVIKLVLVLPNFFKLVVGITFNTTPPLMNT